MGSVVEFAPELYNNHMIRTRQQEIKRRRKRRKEAIRKKGLLKKTLRQPSGASASAA